MDILLNAYARLFRMLPRGLFHLSEDPMMTEIYVLQNILALPTGKIFPVTIP